MLQHIGEFSDENRETNISSSSEDKGAKEIIYAEVVEGDYNDVYSKTFVKGTWEQIETYVKSHFSKKGLEEAEEFGSDGFGLFVMYPISDKNGNEIDSADPRFDEFCEQQESLIQYYVEASEIPYVYVDKLIDLGEQD